MGDLLEIGSAILSQATRRAEVSAQNIANIATPGYKRGVSFEKLIGQTDLSGLPTTTAVTSTDFGIGKQMDTGNPSDLALTGNGFFTVSSGEQILFTRQGQFQRQADGRLTTAHGLALQAAGGGDVVLQDGPFEVTPEGVVIQDGSAVAKLAISDVVDLKAMIPAGNSLFSAPADATTPAAEAAVRQGALESSNVSTADEMVALMEAVRRAETGQRVIGVYDDLMGRALTAFGQP